MKKQNLIWLSLLLCLPACSGNDGKTQVGVLQFGSFDALQQATDGFVETLNQSTVASKINIVKKNAIADSANNSSMAATLASTCDLVYGVATPSAKALKTSVDSQGSNIPVIFSAVTNPAGADLVKNLEAPEGNCTGVIDLGPIADQLEAVCLFGNIAKVASFFTVTEVNSVFQAEIAEDWLDEHNIAHSRETITAASEIASRFAAIPDDVDAVFLPTDDTIADKIGIVQSANRARTKPLIVIGSDVGMISGCTFAIGVDYYQCGVQAAKMVEKIVGENAKISQIPVESCDLEKLTINRTEADQLGIAIPAALLNREGAVII